MIGHIWYYLARLSCAFGFHDWIPNAGIDRYFYPNTTEKCFICGKRR